MRWLLSSVLIGCYAPSPPEGLPCASNGACPDPLVCTAGHCQRDFVADDAAVDAFACKPIAAGAGMLTAPKIASPVLDGDLADWPSCFEKLDPATNPKRDLDGTMRFLSGRFSIAHDGAQLYIAAEVDGIAPLGAQVPPGVYQNNSISIYLDGDGTFATMQYDLDAMQFVVDHANRVQAFRRGATVTVPGVTTFAKTTGTRFTIEAAFESSAFGRIALSDTIGFDIGFEGGDGMEQYSETYWHQACSPPACECMNGQAAPYCDARMFGRAMLAP